MLSLPQSLFKLRQFAHRCIYLDNSGFNNSRFSQIVQHYRELLQALNFDGGGSTTLAIADGKKTRLLNSPIDARIPLRERAIANHIAFHALPK